MSEDEIIVLALALLVSGGILLVAGITLGVQKLIGKRQHLQEVESLDARQTQPSAIRRLQLVTGTKIALIMIIVGLAATVLGGYLLKDNFAASDPAYEAQARELIPRFIKAWRNDRLEESINIIDKHPAVANHPEGQVLMQIVNHKLNGPEYDSAQVQSAVNGAFPQSWWRRESPQIVLVVVRVDSTGKVTHARALIGLERLFPAAETAASQFVFTPATSIPDKIQIEDTQIIVVGFGVDTTEYNRHHQSLQP
jgi:hypothetical protein